MSAAYDSEWESTRLLVRELKELAFSGAGAVGDGAGAAEPESAASKSQLDTGDARCDCSADGRSDALAGAGAFDDGADAAAAESAANKSPYNWT